MLGCEDVAGFIS